MRDDAESTGAAASDDPSGLDFQLLFESLSARYMVMDPSLRIVAASDGYLRATMKTREEILGRNVFEAFPDNPGELDDSRGSNFRISYERVLRDKVPDTMAVQRYDLATPDADGRFETRYWSTVNSPIIRPGGAVAGIIHQVQDVTEFVRLQEQRAHGAHMTAELRQRADEMEAEILQRSQELQAGNRALRAASDAKNEFLSRVSHELRTPLNAILGFGELLALAGLEGAHAEWASTILKAGKHLLALLDDVLDISSIEGGHLSMSVEPVPVAPLLADVVDLARPLADAAGVGLAAAPAAPGGLYVSADRQRLRQILLNLLSNAIKYNHPGGTVALGLHAQPQRRWRISVTDTGRGIPADAAARLFTPFERLDAAQAGYQGTGLGLALSRQLAESMHGTLDFTSHPGQGSAFWIELASAERTTLTLKPGEHDELLAVHTYAGPKRVLYVEDMVDNVRLVEQILTRRPSVTVIPAMLAGVALELAREHRPDLILLDLHLPDMPGEQLLTLLHADPATRRIPVVVLSADATARHVDRLMAAGADNYLSKPIAVRDLLHLADRILGQPASGAATAPATARDHRPLD
ncbi:MAG: hypothetical protein QOD41_156 [Cryptosporangiaceae bacterium]|nr:hypothetical protein [Cryptosporangiaceae bacterium]